MGWYEGQNVTFSQQKKTSCSIIVFFRIEKKALNAFVQVGLWEEGQEEEWKRRVGDRLKEKLERAQEGEEHHVLDHEEEHWMQISGIELHHVSLE